ncbi:phosphohistidine phosphatase SixA [Candidatus Sororendozoicomonas aggregata]|uniref:phosphohistidine phosphatase SixA n=1 Tax=Candidatus Sororendozoicomonas aggregata TaxID=3073239 RepID=UPI002ED447BA
MKLVIMRHGQASWSAPSDALRPLTERGRSEVLSTAKQLKGRYRLSRILASPYRRAQETGELLTHVLDCPTATTLDCLVPEGDPMAVISELPEQESVLLASHMPLVGCLTGLLCDGTESGGPGFHTATAAVLALDLPALGVAQLLSVINP